MGEEIFIDANIFLGIILEEEKAVACEHFLKSLQDKNQNAITTDFIVYSCLIIIERNTKSIKSLKNALMFFAAYSNLRILRPSFDELYSAVEIMESNNLDFDDSLIVACMRSHGIKEIASLDRHFDKIKEIERIKL